MEVCVHVCVCAGITSGAAAAFVATNVLRWFIILRVKPAPMRAPADRKPARRIPAVLGRADLSDICV
jgi:hypothetical protein